LLAGFLALVGLARRRR